MEIKSSFIFTPKKEIIQSESTNHIVEQPKTVKSILEELLPDHQIVSTFEVEHESNLLKVDLQFFDYKKATFTEVVVSFVNSKKRDYYPLVSYMEEFERSYMTCSKIKHLYVCVPSYDGVSEYYCNKIIPYFNSYERALKRLMYSIMIKSYGAQHIKLMGFEDPMLDKRIKVNRCKETNYNYDQRKLLAYFKEFDLMQIENYLFADSYLPIHHERARKIINENQDLATLGDKKIRSTLESLLPTTIWQCVFASLFSMPESEIKNKMADIRKLRNEAAHFKEFKRAVYEDAIRLTSDLSKAIKKANNKLYQKDTNQWELIGAIMIDGLSKYVQLQKDFFTLCQPSVESFRMNIRSVFDKVLKPDIHNFTGTFDAFDKVYVDIANGEIENE